MKTPGPAALVLLAVAAVAAAVLWRWQPDPGIQHVRMPELSAEAQAGWRAFDLYCARCHGEHAGGSPEGPPLVHRTYQRAHHADVLSSSQFGVESARIIGDSATCPRSLA